jgi:hypothetical protein
MSILVYGLAIPPKKATPPMLRDSIDGDELGGSLSV